MGSRRLVTNIDERFRLGRLLIQRNQNVLEISGFGFTKPWPLIAKKLETVGVYSNVRVDRGKTILSCSAEGLAALELIKGHGIELKIRKRYFFAIAIFSGLVVSMFLVPNTSVATSKKVLLNAIQSCDLQSIRSWLEGTASEISVELLDTSIIGGITSGTLSCANTRYSYTLGSEDPKRVLKLVKLDS